jgi:hypothetical protein
MILEFLGVYAFLAAGGFFIGLVFRAPLLMVASGVVVVLLGGWTLAVGFSPLASLGVTVSGVFILQLGYLVGVGASNRY